MKAGLSTKNAPSPKVVIPHYIFGAIAFMVASILMFIAAGDLTLTYIGPHILGLTHVIVLSWITVIIFGALYQLIPVVMELKLYSEKLALASLIFMVIGSPMLVFSFWNNYILYNVLMQAGGTFVIIAVILFAINTIKTALKSTVKTIENKFIVTSIIWLLLTVILGFFIVLNSKYGYIDKSNIDLLKIHFQFGIIGWFLMLVIGVSSTLMPMFFIAHKLKTSYLKYAYYLINGGIIILVILLYFFKNMYLFLFFGITVISGFAFFIKYNYDAYKKRLRKKLDVGMKISVLAFAILFFTLIFAILTIISGEFLKQYSGNIKLAFGALITLGFLSSLILGQMYKTLPFIVWLQKYQDKVGKFKTPLPNDLFSEKIANIHYYTYIVSILSLLIGILSSQKNIIQFAAIAFFITASLFAFNTFKIILHKEDIKPL